MSQISAPGPARVPAPVSAAAPARLGMRHSLAVIRGLREDPFTTVIELTRRYPQGVALRVGRQEIALVTEPDQVWEIFTTHNRKVGKGRGLDKAKRLLGNGLLTSEGEEHLQQRRALQPAFHPEHMQAYLTLMLAATERSMDSWTDGQQLELDSEFSRMTLDAVASALFGDDLRGRADDVRSALDTLIAALRVAMLPYGSKVIELVPWQQRRVEAAAGVMDDIVAGVISGLRDLRAAQTASGATVSGSVDSTPSDAAQRLVGRPTFARQLLDGPIPLTDEQIRDHVLTLLLAGHETTALTLTWAWSLLVEAPDVLAELQREWGQMPAELIALELPATLPVTTAVVAETLRVRPPAWLVGRRVYEPFTVGPFDLDEGTLLMVATAGLHHDPRWWADADRFSPQRWLSGELGSADLRFVPRPSAVPRGGYLPFGAGPRMCIGDQFAWVEATALLATVGRRWTIEPHRPLPVPGRPSITLRPAAPVLATVRRRTE